jgi:glucose dehydrogenase
VTRAVSDHRPHRGLEGHRGRSGRGGRIARRSFVVVAVIASLTVASATAGGAPTCGSTPPPEVAAESDGWPLANRDYDNSRAQFDSEIEASTIDQLERVWEYPVPGSRLFGNLATNPIVVDGRVYVGTLDGSTHAVDLATGTR